MTRFIAETRKRNEEGEAKMKHNRCKANDIPQLTKLTPLTELTQLTELTKLTKLTDLTE